MSDVDLADLDAFAAVARARSFRGAAALRGASASTLSEAVRRLEARLDVRLLNRTTRSVTPTEAGERLLTRLAPALGEVAGALEELGSLRAAGPSGTLRLNAPTVVARFILPPIALRFLQAYPGVRLEIIAQDEFIDVLAAGYDAGIRYDERLEKDMIALPIGPREQRFATVAAPAYLAAHGTPRHPQDLLEHACIRHRFLSGASPAWEFSKGNELLRVAPKGPLVTNSPEMHLAAVEAGLGISYLFEDMVAPQLASGALVEVLPEWSERFTGPRLYYHSRRHMPPALRAFIDFVRAGR
ncbi:LysR family transcriptional regulator [Caulobacter segnis]|uniref:LysR family transcriptional regulator n=1 Tax=Caulobacter segnis TaxID=88688 RepID=UPI0024106AFC|nr:LysR family transcriptional regulator [Caulobacter segnis]MDG2520160.1 LysR family transcriptional regulator [Caulobacter segnis]